MTPRGRTVRLMGLALVLQLALFGYLLFVELTAVKAGGNSTISEIMWTLWATQPWIVFIVSHTVAAPFWFLSGHFFGQARSVYEAVRKETA